MAKHSFSLIESWGFVDVANWLRSKSLGQFADIFVANEIDGSILMDLRDADFVDMGISLIGHRILIKNAIKDIRRSCIQNLANQKFKSASMQDKTQIKSKGASNGFSDQSNNMGILNFFDSKSNGSKVVTLS